MQEKRKMDARNGLQKALEKDDPTLLRYAVQAGEKAGLEADELIAARVALLEHEERATQLRRPTEAVDKCAAERLRSASHECEGLQRAGCDDELAEARARLNEEEERKADARRRMQEALKSRGVEELRSALDLGESVGLSHDELELARHVLGEVERKALAWTRLQTAMSGEDLDELRSAIDDGDAAGLTAPELEDARQLLRKLTRQEDARSQLQSALEDKKVDRLRSAILEGEAARLDASDLLNLAKRALAEEEQRAKALTSTDNAAQLPGTPASAPGSLWPEPGRTSPSQSSHDEMAASTPGRGQSPGLASDTEPSRGGSDKRTSGRFGALSRFFANKFGRNK